MNFLESIRIALEGVLANKMRSFLTMLGVIIGVAAVIAVVAIGQGGKASILSEVEKSGQNLFAIMVKPENDNEGFRDIDEKLMITPEDVKAIKRNAPAVKTVLQEYNSSATIRYNKKDESVQFVGTTRDLLVIRSMNMAKGRFISESDNITKRPLAVIDENLAKDLFKSVSPIGKRVKINNKIYKIIGVSKVPTSSFAFMQAPKTVYVPVNTWLKYETDFKGNPWVEVQAISQEKMKEAIKQAEKILNNRHKTKKAYKAQTLEEVIAQVNKITGVLTLIVGSVAGISLFVGGIGVMNIMLVSVTERTREIGIRKALGAQRKDILMQFLIEALVLCLIGGSIGTIIGISCAFLIAQFAKWPPLVDFWTILIAVGFSLFVGLFFGLYPANKAAKMDPIEALRYE